jgi:hypothetical protein
MRVSLAAAALAGARLWLWIAPGRAVRWAGSQGSVPERPHQRRAARFGRAIARVGATRLFRSSCLQQGIGLVVLLSAFGIPSRLVIGVTRADEGVHAHAWVECDGRVVLGGELSDRFTPLLGATTSSSATCRA